MNGRYKLVDVKTGQTFDVVWLQQGMRPSWGFAMLMQDKQFLFSLDSEVSKAELRLYVFLQSVMDYNNNINWNQAQMARQLKMHKPDVNKAINSLVKRGIIEKVPHEGNIITYKMNPLYTIKGKLMREHQYARA